MATVKLSHSVRETDRKVDDSVTVGKRTYFKQADFPQTSLQQAQQIASTIVDNFAGDGGSPPDIALSLNISPTRVLGPHWPVLRWRTDSRKAE